jgi:sulfoxide reductase heme-binding subunit YedZ
MNDVAWYLSRSTGIVATVLAIAAIAWGFLFSSRETGTRRRPAWWLDLHNWLGGAALAFTLAHLATVYLDRNSGVGLADLFVPGIASPDRLAIAWGVIGTYLFATTVLTSWPRRLFRRRTWRIVHLGSVVGVALALVHGLQIGTDAGAIWYRASVLTVVAVATYTLGIRMFGVWFRRRRPTPTHSRPNRSVPHEPQPEAIS